MKTLNRMMVLAALVWSAGAGLAAEPASAKKQMDETPAAPQIEEAVPEAAKEQPQKETEPDMVTISADRMEMEINNKAQLDGNVVLEDSKMILTSEHVTVFFEKGDGGGDEESGSMKISGVEAIGGVTIRTADGKRSATGERGWFDKAQNKYIIEGNCTILADGHVLKSNRVIYNQTTQTFSAERAKITLQAPGKGSQSKNGKGGLDGFFGDMDKAARDADKEDKPEVKSPVPEEVRK